MHNVKNITNFLNEELRCEQFKDQALNGLQVEASNTVKKIALSVDAGEAVIDKALEAKADLLIVHHGIFWGKEHALTGPYARKISKLFSGTCSLYAAHLPLDAHAEYGNNAVIAKILGLKNLNSFCKIGNESIGFYGELPQAKTLVEISALFQDYPGILKEPLLLNFGPKTNTKIGIVSGSGSSAIEECRLLNLDCLITGESKQEAYHLAQEYAINCAFLGHYGTETFGVKALGELLEKKFQVETFFIDYPTGI
jgi:dinuclear metal center YbgI/SA1388 family protein